MRCPHKANLMVVALGDSHHHRDAGYRSASKMGLEYARSRSRRRLRRSTASGKHESIHKRASSLVRCRHWDSYLMFLVSLVLLDHLSFGAAATRAQAESQGSTLKALARDWSVHFADWEQIEDPCLGNWSGVTCDDATQSQVLVLNLSTKGLQGPIPREIGELVYLRELYLDNNSVQDPVPAEIGNLRTLQILSINQNNLKSPPPEALAACNLTQLSLDQNMISGQLPSWIGQLSNLEVLSMYANEFWGGLPPEWGNLKNLKSMDTWENQLSGFIPDEWRHMTSLERWAIGHQYISGSIPEWLFELPALQYVGFYRNQFLGPFPNISKFLHNGISNLTTFQSYSNCFDNETDTITDSPYINGTENTPQNCSRIWDCTSFYTQVAQNPGYCAPCPSSQEYMDVSKCICGPTYIGNAHFPIGRAIGGIVGGVCSITVVLFVIFILYTRKRQLKYPEFGRMSNGIDDPWTIPKGLRRLTLHELEIATDYFSERHYVGKGSFGSVYHGILNDENHVAIKCALVHSAQGQEQFFNELIMLSRVHHRHLVALIGFCDEDGLQILIYEFIENGDLHDNLFGKNGKALMTSRQRIQVAVGITRGLKYLHTFANPPIIHRDIKPSNILLDIYMEPKLADFGLSKVSQEFHTHLSTQPRGTMGYLDPDYIRTNRLTTASDVYALGVVLLELITGQPIVDYMRLDAYNLIEWVTPRFKQGIKAIVDKNLGDDFNEELYTKIVEIAIQCTSTLCACNSFNCNFFGS